MVLQCQETEDAIDKHALSSQADQLAWASEVMLQRCAEESWLMIKEELHEAMLMKRLEVCWSLFLSKMDAGTRH